MVFVNAKWNVCISISLQVIVLTIRFMILGKRISCWRRYRRWQWNIIICNKIRISQRWKWEKCCWRTSTVRVLCAKAGGRELWKVKATMRTKNRKVSFHSSPYDPITLSPLFQIEPELFPFVFCTSNLNNLLRSDWLKSSNGLLTQLMHWIVRQH